MKKINLGLSIGFAVAFLMFNWSAKFLSFYLYPSALNYAKIVLYDTTQDAFLLSHIIDSMSISLSDIIYTLNLVLFFTTLVFVIVIIISLRRLKQYYITYIISLFLIAIVFFSQSEFEFPNFIGLIPFSFFRGLNVYLITNGVLWAFGGISVFYFAINKFRKPSFGNPPR